MKKYGYHGNLKASEGNGEALASILLEAANLVSQAKGCHLYLIALDQEDADRVWISEVWDTKEDHDASLKAEAVRALIGKAMPLLAGPPEKGVETVVLGGWGIE